METEKKPDTQGREDAQAVRKLDGLDQKTLGLIQRPRPRACARTS